MKRLWILGLGCCILAGGCGSAVSVQETTQDGGSGSVASALEAEELDEYITLGDYKGLELTQTVYVITEERVQEKIKEVLDSTAETLEEDGVICEGDIVNLDYEGRLDGEVLENGTVEDYDLKIGSGDFIEGFEEGLIGAKAGEERTLKLTFPEEYEEEDLAGKDVVFDVTVNKIKRPKETADEEWVQSNTNYETVEDYEASIRSQLESSAESAAQTELKSAAWDAASENAEFLEYPEELLEEYIEMQKESYATGAEYYDMEYEELLESYGMTEDDVEEDAKKLVENEILSAAICQAENITSESELYQEKLEEVLDEYYYDSYEEAVEDGIEEENIVRSVQYYCALEITLDSAQISEEEVEL